jgi:hypothetical protein
VSARLRPLIGAFEAQAWAGLVVALGDGRGAAIRIGVEVPGEDGARVKVAPEDLFLCTHEVGACASDGTYAQVAFDLTGPLPPAKDPPVRRRGEGEASLRWEWALDGATAAIACATASRPLRLIVECAVPWDWTPEWEAIGRGFAATVPSEPAAEALWVCWSVLGYGETGRVEGSSGGPALAIDLQPYEPSLIHLWLDRAVYAPAPSAMGEAEALEHVAEAAERYEARRVVVTGSQEGLAAAVTNNLHWMVLLQPEHHRRYIPAGRRWIFPREAGGRDDWTIFEWDGFFNALLASLEDPGLARDMLAAVLDTQYPNGNVPNWRSRTSGTPDRSQPPVGAFVVQKLVLRTGDLELARLALPALDRWHAWWHGGAGRPGRRRPTGLYAWGSDVAAVPAWVPAWEREASHRQKAAWESGQDDLPNWDHAPWDDRQSTLAMDCVDLSALMAVDARALGWLHERLGQRAEAARYAEEAAALAALVDDRLWDDRRGVWADRFDDGRFSPRLAATNFLPLLALNADEARRARALDLLGDPAAFWGDWVVPTIDRRDPAFADQQYWRGTIWPPTNYLLYEALQHVGEPRALALASQLASRSVALFLGDWRDHQLCRENFSSLDGSGGGQRHQSWGPLFAWIGLAEFADGELVPGIVRVGALDAGRASTVRGLPVGRTTWDITLGYDVMTVDANGRRLLTADGPVRLRLMRRKDGEYWGHAQVARGVRAVDGAGRPLTLEVGRERPVELRPAP